MTDLMDGSADKRLKNKRTIVQTNMKFLFKKIRTLTKSNETKDANRTARLLISILITDVLSFPREAPLQAPLTKDFKTKLQATGLISIGT